MKCFGQKIRNPTCNTLCKVVLLDDQELIQEIQSSSNGQELLDNVFKHLNLIETAYFGLRFIDNTGQANFLDPGKKVIKQLEGTEPLTLYFGVKFYAADPCKLLEEITRYQFFLQIKQDILLGRLAVPYELAAELCAYAVQSELGDYDPRRHCTGYISEFQFVANQTTELETRITELHKSFGGQVPAVAELNYLEKVKWLEMYGVDLHPVLGEDHVDYFLGLTPSGIIVLRNKTKVGNYFWPRISKLNNKGKYFMIKVRNKTNDEQTFGFETPSRAACKHLWKCAVEHHAFFKLVQVAPTALNSGNKMSSLNSRFRDSGRSESSVRRRAQPQFVRTPSRRYTRRAIEGAQEGLDEGAAKEGTTADNPRLNGVNKTVSVPQPVSTRGTMYRTNSMAQMMRADSPRSTKSAPWPAQNHPQKSSSYSIPSPKSVRSAGVGGNTRERDRQRDYSKDRKRSASAESNSSVDSRCHRRRRHNRSRKNSDNESEVSRSSGRSHSKRKHKSSSRKGDSGSESENCHRHKHKNRHRHNSGKYEFQDSEVQWKEAQKKQQLAAVQQAAVVSAAKTAPKLDTENLTMSTRKSGYLNSGLETESEMSYSNKRRHRRQRSKSPKERLPEELKKHIDFKLIDPIGKPEEIPYMKVETNASKNSKIRYNTSMKSNRSHASRQTATENISPASKASELPSTGDSPPPPYTPPVNNTTIGTSKNVPVVIGTANGNGNPTAALPNNGNVPNNGTKTSTKSSFSGKQLIAAASPRAPKQTFTVPPPPSKIVASNMNKIHQYNGYGDFNSVQLENTGRQRKPIMLYNEESMNNDLHHPSPSESPDSQKVDSHHENSDSGLGTDHHEYYKSEPFNSLGYTLPRRSSKDNLIGCDKKPGVRIPENGNSRYWDSQQNWLLGPVLGPPLNFAQTQALPNQERRTMTLDRRTGKIAENIIPNYLPIEKFKQIIEIPPIPAPYNFRSSNSTPLNTTVLASASNENESVNGILERGSRSRSSSLEMILSPMVTSTTRTRL